MKSKLISCYFGNVSRWCELTDSHHAFTAIHGQLVVNSKCFGPAALAVSAKFLENTEYLHRYGYLSSQQYEIAKPLLQWTFDPHTDQISSTAPFCLTSVMLSIYCAMTLQPEDTRSQLRSYINALQVHTWGDSLTFTSTVCFWVVARLDIWTAYQCRQPTLIHEESWLKFSSVNANRLQDHWANRVMHIFSRIFNQVSRGYCDNGVLQELWNALQAWIVEIPECMQPVLELEIAKNDAFPVILFSNSSAGFISLLETSLPRPFPPALKTLVGTAGQFLKHRSQEIQANPLRHARRVGAISISKDENQWINNIEPISIAARHYVKPEEQILILKHLREIRARTGWETAHKSLALRIHWGLE